MPQPAAVGTHPPSSPTSTSSTSSSSSRSSRRAIANATSSGRQRHPGAHRDSNPNKSQSQPNTTITNKQISQQTGKPRKLPTVNQHQQTTPTAPPSTERPGPEGEAEEEEPSEIDSFLLDDNEIESEEENLTRTSNSSPIPNIDQLFHDKGYLREDNDEEEEDSDDLDADLKEVSSISSSTSHRRFLLTENLLSSPDNILTEEFRVAGDGGEPEHQQYATHLCTSSSATGIDCVTEAASKIGGCSAREKTGKGVKTTLIGSVSSEITRSKLGSKVVGINNSLSATSSSLPTDIHPVDPETQARLEALLEAAGIGKLTGETKQLTDPEVLKRLTSSVSCALDEAAAALTRMRTDPPGDGRSLVEACNEGDISKVRKLLDEGRVSVHDTTEEGESLLSLACSAGYFELAQVLLAMRANVEDRGMKGDCTPLMEAASAGHTEIVKLLLTHNAEVNAQSSSGNTPLMYACAGGHEDVVQMLLEAHANVEDHNENGHTPLMEAASAGHVGVAKILLKNGAGINTHSNEFKESALTLACYKGHLEMVRFLLDAGADQEHKTDEMHTALMEASMDGHVEVARLLLDSGAQVNMPADSFESPLTLAACGGHVELAMLLLERGANIEEVNDEGYTPLMEASREGHEEMVALLLSQGADINAQTEETQETALTLACCGGFLEVADFLIKAGANIELGASTPLMESAQEGHIELTKYLLQNGADVNAQSGTGDTALTYACENGHTDVSDLLLKYNAVLEHESEGGRTPLMKAARAGHLCTVQFLISKGADVNRTTTNNDHTPLSLACAGGHISIVELLLQHGADPYHKLKDNSTMLIEAAKGGHTNVVSILIDYPNSLVMTNEAAMSAAGFSDPISGAPQASIHPAHQATPHHVNTAAVHAGQVSISGQMTQEQMAIAMQHEQHNAQVVGGVQVATAHLQTAQNINIVPAGQLTSPVSGPAPPPPPPPPTNHASNVQQSKSVLRKSQRPSSSAPATSNQSPNNQHSGAKESCVSKDATNKLNGKGNASSLASSAARSILSSAAAGMAGVGMSAAVGPNIGIDTSGFDYIEGSGFVMEGLEDKGLDAKSYIQSVLRRHEGGATREEQIIQKEQILAELQRVEKELKEKGPAATASTATPSGTGMSGSNLGQQQYNSASGNKGAISSGNTAISLNIPAATEILQNMANLTLQDQHHRGPDPHPCSSTVTSSTQTVLGSNQTPPHAGAPAPPTTLNMGQEQGINTTGSLGTCNSSNGKRSSSNSNAANLANLLPIERPKVKASRKIPGKESLSPSSKDSNILASASASTSPGGPAASSAGTQQAGQASSTTNIAGCLVPSQAGAPHQQAKKSDSQLQAARHQHSQQLAQLQQLQQLNQQLQEQVLYQRQQKQQNQATLAALQQNAIANQQQLAALQQNVAQLQQLEQHILQQQQATHTTGNDSSAMPMSSGGNLSSSSLSNNVPSSATSPQTSLSSVNTPSNNSSAANQQHQQLQGKIQQIVQQKQQLQAQIKQFQQQVEQQLAYTQNATPGGAGPVAREGQSVTMPSEIMPQNQGTGTRASNKRSKENVDHPSSSKDPSGQKQDSVSTTRQSASNKSNRNKNQTVSSGQAASGESQPTSSVANAAYELVQASQALQAVQALQQQHLDTSATSSSNQSTPSPNVSGGSGGGEIEPLTQDPALLTSLDPAHLAAAVQNCPLPLDANCQAILNGYKEGMQAGQALATTLQAAVNSGSMQIQYPIQVPGGAQGASSDYGIGSGQAGQIGNQPLPGSGPNQMTATSIGLDQLLLQGPQFPFGQASVDSNGQINFTSATDIPGSSYIHHQGPGGTGDTSALFLPAGAQLPLPPGEHGQLVLHQSGGQMQQQHGQLQPELPGVVQGPAGSLECLEPNNASSPNALTGGKKTKHGVMCSKNKKLQQQQQQVALSQDLHDALDKQGQAGDLFSAAAAAAAAAAATAGMPVPSGMPGTCQAGIIPTNCSAVATIEAQQYAHNYAAAGCGPDGLPLAAGPGPNMDGFDPNNEAVAAAAAAAAAAVSVDLDSATESNHDTALTLACAGGHEDLVTLLLGRGSDIEHRDKKGFTPLILAATAGHEKVVEILLEHNADIEAQSERTKDTPLSLACSGGRYEVVEVLLKKHANKEHRNVSDYTPLSLAASGGYVNIIKLLLAHGAEINSRTGSKLGISPLMLAAMNGHTASVKLLLDMGSDINAQIETNRNTALTLACFQGRHEVVSLLLDRKANVEHRAKTGLTPLMEAASGGYVDVGRVLLDKNADVNAPPVPSSRDTALTIAADKGHYRFVELLLSRGAQVDVRNKKGNSSLWLAANGGHIDVVQLLYSAGADIDSQDNRKVSCLMAAFRKGHSKVVKWMVKHVAQYPSDQELTRYIATINDKDLLKKCNTCMDIIRVAKDRQAAEAAKNANSLLEELDREKNIEESKKAAAARKREKKKRKKMEKKGGKEDGSGDNKGIADDDDDCDMDGKDMDGDALTGTEDEKEKTPEILAEATMQLDHNACKNNSKILMSSSNNEGDSGIDANSQGSSASREEKMEQSHNIQNNKDISGKDLKDQAAKKNKNKSKKGKTMKEGTNTATKEKERNERNAASSVSTSEHEPTPPPNISPNHQPKTSNSGSSSSSTSFNKNDHLSNNYQQGSYGKQSNTSSLTSTNITNQYNKLGSNQQHHLHTEQDNSNSSENKENKKQQGDHSNYSIQQVNDTRVPQTPDQPVIINTFESSVIQGGYKKIGRGRRNVTNPGNVQDVHESGYSRGGGTSSGAKLLNAPSSMNNTNSPRKGGSSRGAGNLGPNSGSSNKNNSGIVEDAGWKEVVRKSRKVVVNANAISRVIGRGGNNINAIRELSGAHIEVEKQAKGGGGGSDRTILIKGSADSTRQASTWINAVIANPDKDLTDIIGKPYRQLQAQQQSGAGAFIPSMMQQTVIVNNSGTMQFANSNLVTSASNKCVVTSGQIVYNNSTSAGFNSLMFAKANYTGGSAAAMKLTGSSSSSLMTTTNPSSGSGSKNLKDNLRDNVKDKKAGKSNANIPPFMSSITSNKMIIPNSTNSEKGGKAGSGSFAAVAGGLDSVPICSSAGATPSFGMISAGGPHPGSLNLNQHQQKSRSSGKSGGAPPGIPVMDNRGNKNNGGQYSTSSQFPLSGHGLSLSRSSGIITTTSTAGSQFSASSTTINQDHNMGQGHSCDKDHNYGQYGKGQSQKSHVGLSATNTNTQMAAGGRGAQQSLDNKDYSPFKSLGVVSWGAPNLTSADASKDDKLGTANWASHLPSMGSGRQSNLQPPPSIPLPPSATSGTNNGSDLEMSKVNNQDLASKAPGYRANMNASPSWGTGTNSISNSNKQGTSTNSSTADALIYQQQQERCNSAPGTPISPAVPSPIGPPTSVKPGASSNLSPGSDGGDGSMHSYSGRSGIGPIGPTPGFGNVRSMTPDEMDYRRTGLSTLGESKDGLLGSINPNSAVNRQPSGSSSSLTNKTSMLDPTSDLSILNAAAQMAASGATGFNDFMSQQNTKSYGQNQSFNDIMNVNSGANTLLNQTSGNSARLIGPPAPPPPLPPSMSGGLYNNQQMGTKLNPNAPDFMRTPGTDFVRAPGQGIAPGLGRNLSSSSSSVTSNKYVMSNQFGSTATPLGSRMSYGQGASHQQLSGNVQTTTASSSNQYTSLSNFSNILNNQSINALLNQANLDLSAIGNGGNAFDANLVGGKSIREINEMLSGGGSSTTAEQSTQPFSGTGASLFNMNNPMLNSHHGGSNNSALEEQPKSKAIGSERHRSALPSGLQSGLPPPQPPTQGPIAPSLMNKSIALNRGHGGGLRTQAPSNPWDSPGYYDGSGDHSSTRQNQSGQPTQQFPFPSSLQGHTLESLLKSTAGIPSGMDNFGEHSATGTGPQSTSIASFMPGLGNGSTSAAPPSPLSGLGSPANVTPNKNDFGAFGGDSHAGMAYPGSHQAPIGSAGKTLSAGYSLDPSGNRSNDPAVNSVRRNMNTMWGNSGAISSKKWGDEM